MSDTFLRQQARTQHFTLGAPRRFAFSQDGQRLFFLRSKGPYDSVGCLWMVSLEKGKLGKEQLLVDPSSLKVEGEVPAAEKRRRERAREATSGIVAFSIDSAGTKAAFALNGDVYVVDCAQGAIMNVAAGQGAYDPRMSPDGKQVAYVAEGSLYATAVTKSAQPRLLIADDNPDITWGMTDFIGAEEMGRLRGFWWSPESTHLLVEKVDNTPVQTIYIADPENPTREPQHVRYPFAGTANALLSLAVVSLDGGKKEVSWDHEAFPYIVDVQWNRPRPLLTVQSRDQKTVEIREVSPESGRTQVLQKLQDKHWVELLPGLPTQLANGSLVYATDVRGARRLKIDDKLVSASTLIIRSFCGVLEDDSMLFTAWRDDPKQWDVWRLGLNGTVQRLTSGDGVFSAVASGKSCVIHMSGMADAIETTVHVLQAGELVGVGEIKDLAASPLLHPAPKFYRTTVRNLESALILPQNMTPGAKLPVLLSPYGGPGAQQVVMTSRAYFDAQWWANQGFAVVITDNRGTPGRGPRWEKEIAHDLIGPVLEDQIAALQALAAQHDFLDLGRVGIKGWSFGGYLAAYAAVRYPEVFHAAVAGAPVTDWRLYDTHYTERYLGDPNEHPRVYDNCSLLCEAKNLQRPLLLVHGFADDNVVVANSLQFSSALLEAGRSHQVLPLSGVTHMASQEVVAENLEKMQLAFFAQHLQAKELPPKV